MTPQEATEELLKALSKHCSHTYINQPPERYETLLHTVQVLLAQGADVDMPSQNYQGTPFLNAIEYLHSPEIIQLLWSYSSNPNHFVLTRDYVEGVGNECFTITRIKNIHNILLTKHHILTNDFSIDIKLVEMYKKLTNYVPYIHPVHLGDKKGTIVKKKSSDTIISEESNDSEGEGSDATDSSDDYAEEILRTSQVYPPRELILQFMEIRLKEYCSMFNLSLNEIINRGEIYPDDLTK